ncbi:MAG: hypothetical protein JRJ62_12985 [Deltaproteobacteria bacterium]|nr:hypothetical protein [Deltaproteobacteria bacterium]MBW2169221.1 hypothetical protein [Deltaproteobacteria bacterium]
MDFLSDHYIFTNCKRLQLGSFPEFLSENSEISLQKILENCEPGKDIPPDKIDEIHALWKDLLSDAVIYLKRKDKREFRNAKEEPSPDKVAFGVDDLYKYFEEYREFEALLYGADRFYRDHIMHVFKVWLIGNWLIEKFNSKIHWDFKKISRENSALDISNEEVSAMWCIIALTHDLGYPLDKIEKVRDKIEAMMAYFGGAGNFGPGFQIPAHHHFINDFILKFISSKLIPNKESTKKDEEGFFQTAMQSKYYLKFSKSFEKFDHGIISCILLMKNLVYFLESDFDLSNPFTDQEDARQFYIRREILRAIASHTCTDIYHLYPNSLAFILILADELQMSGRPTFSELKIGRPMLKPCVKIPVISKREIEIVLKVVEEEEEGGGKELFFALCRKWHKWLRGALDASRREFVFSFKVEVKSSKGKTKGYNFINKPYNLVEIYVDDNKDEDLLKTLYS